jgi:hypothetical protein
VITKRVARADDDGYRHPLVPGLKATIDAARMAACLAVGAARLEFPGPHPRVAELADDSEQAIWLAFLLSLAPEDLQAPLTEANPAWPDGDVSALGADATIAAYRTWAARAGSQLAAVTGEPAWSPSRRFARVFDRLALPGFARAQRYEFLVTLGAAGIVALEPDALHVNVAHDDATTLAAKRALNSGDAMLLERRAADLARAAGVPIGALDRGLALWDSTVEVDAPPHDAIRAALHV